MLLPLSLLLTPSFTIPSVATSAVGTFSIKPEFEWVAEHVRPTEQTPASAGFVHRNQTYKSVSPLTSKAEIRIFTLQWDNPWPGVEEELERLWDLTFGVLPMAYDPSVGVPTQVVFADSAIEIIQSTSENYGIRVRLMEVPI